MFLKANLWVKSILSSQAKSETPWAWRYACQNRASTFSKYLLPVEMLIWLKGV